MERGRILILCSCFCVCGCFYVFYLEFSDREVEVNMLHKYIHVHSSMMKKYEHKIFSDYCLQQQQPEKQNFKLGFNLQVGIFINPVKLRVK